MVREIPGVPFHQLAPVRVIGPESVEQGGECRSRGQDWCIHPWCCAAGHAEERGCTAQKLQERPVSLSSVLGLFREPPLPGPDRGGHKERCEEPALQHRRGPEDGMMLVTRLHQRRLEIRCL